MKQIFFTVAKRSAITAAMVMLLASPFAPLVAQAQEYDGNNIPAFTGDTTNPATTPPAATTVGASAPAAAAAANQSVGVNNSSSIGCNISTAISNFGGTFALCLTNIVYVFTVGIGSGFTYVAAYFFDWAIALSLNGGSYALTFVSQGWTTARDIANMAFLFILLFIAFKVIFEAETNETVHMLTWVIVIALLVNFSFFFTRLVIDAGNILSIQFYNAIQAPTVATTASGQTAGTLSNSANASQFFASSNSKDLTYSIMGMLQLQNLFNTNSFQAFFKGDGTPNAGAGFLVTTIALSFLYIAAAIMFWLLTVAFVTNGVKFLFRIVILWFLIIASPLAFVARTVPKFKDYYTQWQSALISHAFYPAAFMFIFLILTNFATQMSCVQSGAAVQGCAGLINGIFNGLQAANSSSSAVAAIGYAAANVGIRLGFVIAMLYVGMEAAKKIGVMGASMAEHAGSWVGGRFTGAFKKTGGAAISTVGWTGRNVVGAAATAGANTTTLRNWESRTGLLGLVGRGTRATLGSVGRASFDVRAAPVVGKALGDSLGKAQKGGYEASLKERTKVKEERAKALEPSEGQKMVAREQAEKENPDYKKIKTQHESVRDNAKREIEERIDPHLDALKLKGEDRGDEANSLRAEKVGFETQMRISNRQLQALEKVTKARAEIISGEGASKKYAETLGTPNIRNLWIPLRSSREAKATILKGKSEKDKMWEAAKKVMEEENSAATSSSTSAPTIPIPPGTPPPSAPPPRTPPPASADGGH